MAIRSGRFTVDDNSTEFNIILGRAGAFYRILNSGEKEFSIVRQNQTTPLGPTFSLDVSTGVAIAIQKLAGDAVEGIYEYLDVHMPVRSGRFNLRVVVDDEDNLIKHPIIDLTGPSDDAWYRMFNSGVNPIEVVAGNKLIHTLTKDQSVDFEVGNSDRVIYVRSTADDKPIEGIYDYLNTERAIRSGRFRKELNIADRHKIIDLAHGGPKVDAFYRIFNSGRTPFAVRRKTGMPLRELAPDQSFDFEILQGGDRDIYVNPLTDDTEIEGIYDFLGQK